MSHKCGDAGATNPCGAEAICSDSHTLLCDDFEDGDTTGWSLSTPFTNATDLAYAGTHALKNSWSLGLNYSRGTAIFGSSTTTYFRAYWRASGVFYFSGAGANSGNCTDPSQRKFMEINRSDVGDYDSRLGIFLEPDNRCSRGVTQAKGKWVTTKAGGSDITVSDWNMFPNGSCTACPPGGHQNISTNPTTYLTGGGWHCVEIGVTQAGAGIATGAHVQYWIDSILQVDVSNEQLGALSTYISIDGEHNGGTEIAQQEWWDNIVVSTQRIGCGTGGGDTEAPAQVTDLCVGTLAGCAETSVASTSAPLRWTSAGDNTFSGLPSTYFLRAKVTTPPVDCLPFVEADWAGAIPFTPPPLATGGTLISTTVTGLTPNRNYCFAVKTRDEVPNESPLSLSTNLNRATTPPLGSTVCGNGQVEKGESCDGAALGGQTCKTLGFPGGGTLTCLSDCKFDTTSCTLPTSSTPVPVIWFLDVTSAPVGAYVAIRGKNLGDAVGSVTVGGTNATVVSWSTSRVVITVPSKTTGATYPVVLTKGTTSVTAPTGLQVHATTATRYVNGAVGSDTANTCASAGAPCATIARAYSQAAAGNVILIRSGTYVERLVLTGAAGTAALPLVFRGYPGETVTLDCDETCSAVGADTVQVRQPYIQFANLGITGSREDGIQLHSIADRVADCRIFEVNQGTTADSSGGSGITAEAASAVAEILGNDIYTNGSSNPPTHPEGVDKGVYVAGSNPTIAWNTVHDNAHGNGVYVLGASAGAKLFSNTIYSNAFNGIEITGSADDSVVVNNIIYSNTRSGLRLATGGDNFKIQNNTVYGNGGTTYYQLDLTQSGPTSSAIRSNITAGGSNAKLVTKASAFVGTFSNNLYYNTTLATPFSTPTGASRTFAQWQSDVSETSAQFTTPDFVSATDFHLKVSSLAINRSAALAPGYLYDFEGVARPFPATGGSDVGASEFQPGTSGVVGGGSIRGARFSVTPL